jgi:hypothetical protein
MSENTETAILAGGRFSPAQELLRHQHYPDGKNQLGPEPL